MMYGYYGSDGFSGSWSIAMHLHMLFALLLFFAFIAALVWLFRFAKESQLKKILWTALFVGVLGVLLTAPMASWGMQSMMQDWYDYRRGVQDEDASAIIDEDRAWGMMDWYSDQEEENATEQDTVTE